MASELTIDASFIWKKGGVQVGPPLTKTKTQTVQSTLTHAHHDVQAIGTSSEDAAYGDVDLTKQHIVQFFNRDATNFVTVYARKDVTPTDTVVGIMLPGEPWGPVRLSAQSGGYPKILLKADTAACDVEVFAAETGNPAL